MGAWQSHLHLQEPCALCTVLFVFGLIVVSVLSRTGLLLSPQNITRSVSQQCRQQLCIDQEQDVRKSKKVRLCLFADYRYTLFLK